MTTNHSFLSGRFRRNETRANQTRAFTFVELLIVLAVLALIVCVFATARAASRPNFQGALCLNNMRQLMAAFTMYTHDSSEFFPPNPDAALSTPGCSWVLGAAWGWFPPGNSGSPDAGNPDILRDGSRNLLAAYTRTNISLFRCPFDPRIAPYAGSDTNLVGQMIPVIRDVSMNQGVGTKGACLGGANANSTVDGPWLNGSHSHTANNPYATFGRWSDFTSVRPSEIWVLVDDDPWTINDSSMAVIAASPDTVDYVNFFNNNGTAFAFADGHAEIHKWKSSVWVHNSIPTRSGFDVAAAFGLGYQDWFWWASHATRSRITGTVP
jgi:prepilin-type N-terminal cleavage/methylation domain-containing protein/prepilin-type processing-associated H-X9-DG protein